MHGLSLALSILMGPLPPAPQHDARPAISIVDALFLEVTDRSGTTVEPADDDARDSAEPGRDEDAPRDGPDDPPAEGAR